MPPRGKAKTATVVIGLDFGTTYSGVAWAWSSSPSQVKTVTSWRSLQHFNTDKEKTPSAIIYKGEDDPPEWGYAAPYDENCLRWFKLLLIDEKDLPKATREYSYLKQTRAMVLAQNRTPVEVISDYLKELWGHTMDNINREGNRLLKISKIQVIVTIPAIWPHYAQARMREAVENAGLLDKRQAGETSLAFVSEPEAAALAVLEDLKGRADIKAGQHFVVCDAGGGTVDLISYRVTSLTPFTICESVQGDGDLCGSSFLDNEFLTLMKKLIPKDIWDRLGPLGIRKLMNDEWENGIKPAFCSAEDKWDIVLPYGGTPENGYHPPKITIYGSQVKAIFRPNVQRIEQLVKSQIDEVKSRFKKAPEFVVLVGGFGRSCYLYQSLREALNKNIDLLQGSGSQPWTAICRGAVIRGQAHSNTPGHPSMTVDTRIARASYGTLVNVVPFDPNEHNSADRTYCEVQCAFLAVDQVEWFLRTGEEISSKKPVCYTFWQDVENTDEGIEIELVTCKDAEPPTRNCDSVKSLCMIKLADIPNNRNLPRWTNTDGKEFRRVNYEVKMISDGASMDIAVYHKGKRIGSQNVSIEFSSTSKKVQHISSQTST